MGLFGPSPQREGGRKGEFLTNPVKVLPDYETFSRLVKKTLKKLNRIFSIAGKI